MHLSQCSVTLSEIVEEQLDVVFYIIVCQLLPEGIMYVHCEHFPHTATPQRGDQISHKCPRPGR